MNLKYLGWLYRAYNKTAKKGGFREELLSENDFEVVLAFFCCFSSSPKWRQKVKHRMWWLFDYVMNFRFIWFFLHVDELNFCFQFFSFNCNFDFFYKKSLKKLQCRWVMINKLLIMSDLMTMVAALLRQFRRSLQIKKSITNALGAL